MTVGEQIPKEKKQKKKDGGFRHGAVEADRVWGSAVARNAESNSNPNVQSNPGLPRYGQV